MNSGKTSRYLKYAIGEIILVVLGILIALQINNWNEERKSRQSEKKIIERLKLEFEGASDELSDDIEARKEILSISEYLSGLHLKGEQNSFNPDTLAYSLTQLMRFRFFTQSHPALNDLQSSGRLELLSSEQLKEYLLKYLQAKERLATFEGDEAEFVDLYMTPYLTDHLNLLKSIRSTEQEKLMEAKEFRELLVESKMGSLLFRRIEETKRALFYSEIMADIIKDVIQELDKRK